MDIKETLDMREEQYGHYKIVGQISQEIKKIMQNSPNYRAMPEYMRESMDMIANKMARILNGNYYLNDSWHDISGYASLVVMTNEDLYKDDKSYGGTDD
jgi:hypothetical protein